MRHAKGKNAKRAKGFFTLAAGFKQPYKVGLLTAFWLINHQVPKVASSCCSLAL